MGIIMKNRTLDKDSRMAIDCINNLVYEIEELEETIQQHNEKLEELVMRIDDLQEANDALTEELLELKNS